LAASLDYESRRPSFFPCHTTHPPPFSAPCPYPPLFRSGDRLGDEHSARDQQEELGLEHDGHGPERATDRQRSRVPHEQLRGTVADRKSTRLNSSHEWISYAVFCLKKKR